MITTSPVLRRLVSLLRGSIPLFLLILLVACQEKRPTVIKTPWGTTIATDAVDTVATEEGQGSDTEKHQALSLEDIKANGEMIMLTISGPQTYYDYHGKGMGVNYLMCEKLAAHLGVTLRIDVCTDTLDMLRRLENGEGDVIAVPMDSYQSQGKASRFSTKVVANGWLTNSNNPSLADAISKWYKPTFLAETQKQETYLLTSGSVTRHVYPWMLSAEKGQVSTYDNLFKKYAPNAGVDWTLLAAQCYQESCFDPKAHSWAGACGLMQIMPSTADHLALPRSRIYDPEANVAAAARYMRELQEEFKDVANPAERLKFALASYNGGLHHVRDAMALTKKHGGVQYRWGDVRHYILALSKPEFYRDPVVKSGYMRGTETANYVDMIVERQRQYRHALRTGTTVISKVKVGHSSTPSHGGSSLIDAVPHRAAKKNKWREKE